LGDAFQVSSRASAAVCVQGSRREIVREVCSEAEEAVRRRGQGLRNVPAWWWHEELWKISRSPEDRMQTTPGRGARCVRRQARAIKICVGLAACPSIRDRRRRKRGSRRSSRLPPGQRSVQEEMRGGSGLRRSFRVRMLFRGVWEGDLGLGTLRADRK
jgi:hypothetical protein